MRGRTFLGAWISPRRDFCAVLGAVVLFWIAYDNGSYTLTSRTTVAIAIWWTLAIVIVFGLARGTSLTRVTIAAGSLLLALSAWTLASSLWAPSAEAAFADATRTMLYLGVYWLVVLLAVRRDVALWCNGLAFAIVAVAAVALVSRFFPDVFSDRGLATFLPSSVSRLSFPLGYWNGLGTFVALGGPLLLRVATAERSVIARSLAVAPFPLLAAVVFLTSSRGGVITALTGAVVFVVLTERRWSAIGSLTVAAAGAAAAIAVLLDRDELVDGPLGTDLARSQGREAALLLVLACAATALVHWSASRVIGRRFRPNPWVGRVVVAVLGIALLAGALASHPIRRFETFKQSPAGTETVEGRNFVRSHLLSGTGNGRWQWWSAALDEWKEHPLQGQGAGSFEQWWSEHASFTYFVRDAHSLYVESLGELGVIGLGLVVALVLTGLVAGGRRAIRGEGDVRVAAAALTATFAAYALAAGLDWMWELPAVSVVGFVALGLVTGLSTARVDPPRLARRDERLPLGWRHRWGFGVAGLLVAWAVIAAQLIPLLAQRALARSEAAVERGDLADAEGEATAARNVQPWAASPYLQLALVAEERGDLSQARRRIREAIERDPRNWRLWLTATRIDVKLGDLDGAETSLRRAVELNPRSPLFKGLLDGRGG